MRLNLKSVLVLVVISMVFVVSCKRRAVYQGEPIVTDLEVHDPLDFYQLKEQYKGKILVVNYFASWCPPCRAEAPDLLRVYNKYKDKNFVIVGYTIDTNKNAAMDFINNFGLDFPTFIASDLLQDEMRVRKVPETFIYDKEGNLLEMVPGMVSERYLEVFAEMGNNPSE